MPKPTTNDLIVRQARERTRQQIEANAKRAVIEIGKVLPPSAHKTRLSYGKEIEEAIIKEFASAS